MTEARWPIETSYGPLLILCDWAEVINGKLYMMGAGWSRIRADNPVNVSLAIMWKIPWSKANEPQDIEVALLTEDGKRVARPDGKEVALKGQIEAGRPPGMKFGSPLDAPLAVTIGSLQLEPGRYRFELSVNGELATHASFDAVGGTP